MQRRTVALLAVVLIAATGCSKCESKDNGPGPSFSYHPMPGAWPDLRAQMSANDWRRGTVTIQDRRDSRRNQTCYLDSHGDLRRCENLESGKGTLGRGDPERIAPLVQRPVNALAEIASCVMKRLPFVPERGLHASVNVSVLRQAILASPLPDSQRFAGLQACIDATTKKYHAMDNEPGTIEVSFSVTYNRWCDVLPTGLLPADDATPAWLSGIKGPPFFMLHRAPFGYWLLSCSDPESSQVRVDGDTVEVHARSGARLSVAHRSAQGFTISDGSGKAVLIGTGPRERLSLSSDGEALGDLLRAEAGDGDVRAKLVSATKTLVVFDDNGRVSGLGRGVLLFAGSRREVPEALVLLGLPALNGEYRLGVFQRVAGFALLSNWR
ncbi:MAG TPA: hypothetical protein VIV60_14920 [Polyangiaceae bacterium]